MEHEGTEIKKGIINCKTCGFIHLNPIPTDEELNDFYKNNYFESTGKTNLKDKFETLDSEFRDKSIKRILDIGCWDGEQIEYFKKAGWDCLGIEPNPVKTKEAENKGIKVINKMFDEIDDKELGKFDVINLSTVLEHLPNPYSFIKRVYGLLNENGMICIDIPNDFSELQRAVVNKYHGEDYGVDNYWVHAPDHINYWNLDSIKRFLEKAGFKIILMEGSFPKELFLLFGDNYVSNPELGKVCHRKQCNFEEALINDSNNKLKRKIYEALGNIGVGRSFIIFARKSNAIT